MESYIKKADSDLKPARPFGNATEHSENRSSDHNAVYDYEKGSEKGFVTKAIEKEKNK
ncbi:MAG: hypothetical protein NC350_03345 [Corallococcus sp.]|nr:hypothetical protein [Corallococcus sp.]